MLDNLLWQSDVYAFPANLNSSCREKDLGIQAKHRLSPRRIPMVAAYPEGLVLDKVTLMKAKGLAKHRGMTCVLMGETGTGKEEFAKLIHGFRSQLEGKIPFVPVNCASLNDGLADSLLFGHKKGAFTGADQTTRGYIMEADGGILFLDEIHTLSLASQQKLLRVLADGSFNRIGETRTCSSRFQLFAATTRDLDDEVEVGRFLLDLRGRITGLDIHLPPLRERKSDIPALVDLFLARRSIDCDEATFEALCDRLSSYYWKGNIRQLYKVLDAWVLLCEFHEVQLCVDMLPVSKGMLPPKESHQGSIVSGDQRHDQKTKAEPIFKRALVEDMDLGSTLREFEKSIIMGALARHSSPAKCARALRLPRSTFDAKRRKYGI